MITKILKNTTANDLILINTLIPAMSEVFIEATLWAKLIQEGSVFSLIESGTLIVNDGSKDLNITNAVKHIYAFQDIGVANNFSYRIIRSGTVITIPYEQQMIEYQEIDVRLGGELDIEGEAVIL